MTRIRRDTDLVSAILDLRRAGELLAHPCECKDGKPHTLGVHLFHSTKDMRPGIRAAAPGARGNGTSDEPDAEAGPVDAHDLFTNTIGRGQDVARDIISLLERWRPDRLLTVVPSPADDDWCRACLAAGYCEPRFRDQSLCRWCTEFALAYRMDPPVELNRHRHEGRRITQGEVTAAVAAERKRLKAAKRKARSA